MSTVNAPWDDAVAAAAEDPPPDAASACREELQYLWTDLSAARNRAYRNRWSMECDWLTTRIVTLSRIAGVTPWEQVQTNLLLDGTYTGILSGAGLEFTPPDLDAVREVVRATT